MRTIESTSVPSASAPVATPPGEDDVAKLRSRDITYDDSSTRQGVSFLSSTCLQVMFTHNSSLRTVIFDNCVLINVKFVGCTISDTVFRNVYLEDVISEACSLQDVVWENRETVDVDIAGVKFNGQKLIKLTVPRLIEDPARLRNHLVSYVLPLALDIRSLAELPALEEEHTLVAPNASPVTCDASTMTDKAIMKDASSTTEIDFDTALDTDTIAPATVTLDSNLSCGTRIAATHLPCHTASPASVVPDTIMLAEARGRGGRLHKLFDSLKSGNTSMPILDSVARQLHEIVSSKETSPTPSARVQQSSIDDGNEAAANVEAARQSPDRPVVNGEGVAQPSAMIGEVMQASQENVQQDEQHGAQSFTFMDIPDHIRQRVYKLLLAPSELIIEDWECGGLRTMRRLRYQLAADLKPWEQNPYFSWYAKSTSRRTGIKTGVLRASKVICNEAARILYGQTIRLECSAQGALSFLHNISENLPLVKLLEFTYLYGEKYVTTDSGTILHTLPSARWQPWEFHRLMNCLVHKCSGLEHFKLDLSSEFWRYIDSWRAEIGHSGRLDTDNNYLPFKEIARLPTDTRCTIVRDGRDICCFRPLRLDLSIHGLDWADDETTKLKQEFLDHKGTIIEARRSRRPYDMAIARPCNCTHAWYTDCCYLDLPANEMKSRSSGSNEQC